MHLLLRRCTLFFSNNIVHASSYINKMSVEKAALDKIKGIPNGESLQLKDVWQDQDTLVVFFRRWGCMLCRLWAKELGEIAPVLQKHNIKLVGIGVEDAGSKEFIDGKYFDGDLYYVENLDTYKTLGFKRFNTVSIITSLFWKQSRDAIFKGRGMGLGGDLKGDWVQTGGALLVQKGGKVLKFFVQSGPGDHYPNKDILQTFGLEQEYKPETMANQKREGNECPELLALCLIGAVVAEPPAPYAPSGWRPSGPAFELPQRQNTNYLPPVDPRTPAAVPDAEDDVRVQGLPPRQEQLPIFQPSPINGQQYVGPQFNADIQNLDQSLNQAQFQVQQQKAREFARQKQENEARQPSVNTQRPFNPRTNVNPTQTAFTQRPEFRTTTATAVTDFDLNEGETDEVVPPAVAEKQKVTVEVTKQNIQEYPPELFLNPLAQLSLQPFQLSQSPFLISGEQSQKQVAGFDAQTHFAALPSIIAQQQLEQQRGLLQQYPGNQAAYVISGQTSNKGFLIQRPQPLQSVAQLQPLVQPLSPFQGQNVAFQPQGVNQLNSEEPKKSEGDDENDEDEERDNKQPQQPQNPVVPQFGYQPQSQVVYQPQAFQQPQLQQPQVIYQPQPAYQPQAETVYQQPQGFQQPQAYQPQQVAYPQPALQPQPAYQPQAETVYQQPQEGFQQPQAYQPQQVAYPQPALQPQPAYQPQVETVYQQNQFQQPQVAYQPQQVAYQPALQPQAVFQQPQAFQPQDQPQIYQPQTSYQPQVYKPQPQLIYNQQPQTPDQQIYPQGQLVTAQNLDQFYQQQQSSPQVQRQGQDALQSGFDVNQQGNSLDQDKDEDANEDDGATATAVATAFGARTQPRVYTRYGAPVPRAQTATTESPVEEVTTEEGPAIAEATAVARGGRRKSAKLRQRRIRPDSPIFTLDKSGRLVLISEQ